MTSPKFQSVRYQRLSSEWVNYGRGGDEWLGNGCRRLRWLRPGWVSLGCLAHGWVSLGCCVLWCLIQGCFHLRTFLDHVLNINLSDALFSVVIKHDVPATQVYNFLSCKGRIFFHEFNQLVMCIVSSVPCYYFFIGLIILWVCSRILNYLRVSCALFYHQCKFWMQSRKREDGGSQWPEHY